MKYPEIFKVLTCLIFLCQSCFSLMAQYEVHYTPRKTYTDKSVDLIAVLKNQVGKEFEGLKDIPNEATVRQINDERKKLLITMVEKKAFINDDSLEQYVNKVVNTIVERNSMEARPRKILISRNPYVNAVCYGRGIYIVTVSLLGRISNEDQLAFTLAHEMAHDELNHVRNNILTRAEINLSEKAKEQAKKIYSGKIEIEDIEEFRKLIYGVSKYSREREREADSMAFVLLKNAGYDRREGISMLTILDEADVPKHAIHEEMFLPFDFEEYPFQVEWLNERLSVFSRKYTGNYMYQADSLESHPAIEIRKKTLKTYLAQDGEMVKHQPLEFVQGVIQMAELETVEAAFKSKEYDRCIFYALQLLRRYPHNAYLITRIGNVLTDLYEAKNNNVFDYYVSKFTSNYGKDLRLVNNFLHNMTLKELGDVTFYFLHSASNFNKEERRHYYLLKKISELTYRFDVSDKMKRDFKQKFGKSISSYQPNEKN